MRIDNPSFRKKTVRFSAKWLFHHGNAGHDELRCFNQSDNMVVPFENGGQKKFNWASVASILIS